MPCCSAWNKYIGALKIQLSRKEISGETTDSWNLAKYCSYFTLHGKHPTVAMAVLLSLHTGRLRITHLIYF